MDAWLVAHSAAMSVECSAAYWVLTLAVKLGERADDCQCQKHKKKCYCICHTIKKLVAYKNNINCVNE